MIVTALRRHQLAQVKEAGREEESGDERIELQQEADGDVRDGYSLQGWSSRSKNVWVC